MDYVSICLGVLAIAISFASFLYARRSAIASERSAAASESSAQTTREALSFQRKTHTVERDDRQEERIASLVKEVHDKMNLKGDVFWIFDRELNLSNEEQNEIIHRVYHGLGHSKEREQQDLERWRAEQASKK